MMTLAAVKSSRAKNREVRRAACRTGKWTAFLHALQRHGQRVFVPLHTVTPVTPPGLNGANVEGVFAAVVSY
jgi:hypothetical protein